jgi:tetratricopeptide (TPR) repeat protein
MTVSTPASLLFTLVPGEETWTIVGPMPDRPPRVVPSPLADTRFRRLVASLREWASRPVPLDRPDPLGTEAFVRGLARRVSQRLTDVLLAGEDRRALVAALAANGRVRLLLRVRPAAAGTGSAADAALALPWELLAPEEPGAWPVRDGRLAVIREAVADGAPGLPEPAGPLTLAAVIAAPEDRVAFAYEQEAFRLLAALSPLGQRAVFSDLGGLEDLAELVAAIRATAIHFRGHGLPGGLLFENALGFAEEVPVGELRRRLAAILLSPRRAGSFPGLFFLAAPYTAREVLSGQDTAAGAFPEESSAAAALHRSGFAQVVGYFGPVSADLTTRLEERFYEALAEGGSTLAAVELARSVLNEPLGAAGERVVYPFGWTQLAVYHRGPDRPLALPGRGTRLPSRFRRRMVQVHGLPVLERGFIGRRDLLHEIRRRVHEGRRLLVLQGLGGLGKTALASHLLARLFEVKPTDRLILRCQEAEGAADPVLVLRGQAEDHGRLHRFGFWDERMKDLRERFQDPVEGFVEVIRTLRRDRPHLAIYADNAESLQEGPKTGDSRALGTWRPGAEAWWRALERLEGEGDGLILLTTRYLWSDLGDRSWVGIGSMGLADSLRMIDSFPSLAKLPREVRTRIAERVDGHPRTVEYLDRLVAWQRRKLGRKRLRDPWRELIEPVLPEQAKEITADLLLEEIWRRLSEAAKEHATAISVLRIPAPQFVIDRLGEARDELIRAGLLSRFMAPFVTETRVMRRNRWFPHALVRERLFVGLELDHLAHLRAGEAYESWIGHQESVVLDTREAVHHLHRAGEGDRAWPVLGNFVLWLHEQARYREAEELLADCEANGTTGERLALALSILAKSRDELGQWEADFLPLLERAMSLASSSKARSVILRQHGNSLLVRGCYREAEEPLRQGLAEVDENSGADNSIVGSYLYGLASALRLQGRLPEAETLIRRVLAMDEASLMQADPSHAATLQELASIVGLQGRLKEAEEMLRRSLAIRENALGAEHPDCGITLFALGGALRDQGRYLEAEEVLRRSLATKENVHGPEHPSALLSRVALAGALQDQGHSSEAGELLMFCLGKLEPVIGCSHPTHAHVLHTLAKAFRDLGRYLEAENLLRRALESSERSLGADHHEWAAFAHSLALTLGDQGRWAEAEPLLLRALHGVRKTLGAGNAIHAALLGTLSLALHDLGRPSEAIELIMRGLREDSSLPGADPVSRSILISHLSTYALERFDLEKGAALLRQALNIVLEERGDASAVVAWTKSLLTLYEILQGRAGAVGLAREAMSSLLESSGPDHPLTRDLAPLLRAVSENEAFAAAAEDEEMAEALRTLAEERRQVQAQLRTLAEQACGVTIAALRGEANREVVLEKLENAAKDWEQEDLVAFAGSELPTFLRRLAAFLRNEPAPSPVPRRFIDLWAAVETAGDRTASDT